MPLDSARVAPVTLRIVLEAQVDPEAFAAVAAEVPALVPAVAGPLAAVTGVEHLAVSSSLSGGIDLAPAAPGGEE